MGFLTGKLSDAIRSGGSKNTNPERPNSEGTKVKTPHEGHQLSKPNRKGAHRQ